MLHSACTIHLLNLPEKTARRDITHGAKHLEEIAEDWLCARRTLSILSMLARKWNCELPEDAAVVLQRTDEKYGTFGSSDASSSPRSQNGTSPPLSDRNRSHVDTNMAMGHPFGHSQLPQAHPHLSNTPLGHQSPGGVSQGHGMGYSTQASSAMGSPAMNHASQVEPMGCWTQPQQMMNVSFPTMFSPMPAVPTPLANNSPRNEPTRAPPHNFRHGSTGSVNMDGPDWFLKDSVHWHQGFETWDLNANNNQPQNGQVFTFGENRSNSSDGAPESLSGFEGLGASLNNESWLTGLD
jgi:hypothetical protein